MSWLVGTKSQIDTHKKGIVNGVGNLNKGFVIVNVPSESSCYSKEEKKVFLLMSRDSFMLLTKEENRR